MKKTLFLFLFLPLFSFSQGNPVNSVNWTSLAEAEKYSEKYNKNMLIYFYRNNCDYCKRMKDEVLTDPQIIKLINENFLPVMLDGKSKKPIKYNGTTYVNDHPNEEDAPWRHNLFVELVEPVRGNYYWPNVVIINNNAEKIVQYPGFQPSPQLIRGISRFIK